MPPGPAFGWLCVAHSVVDIAIRAAQIRNARVIPQAVVHTPPASGNVDDASRETLQPRHVELSTWSSLEPVPNAYVSGERGTPVRAPGLEVPVFQGKSESTGCGGVVNTEGCEDISRTHDDAPKPNSIIQQAAVLHPDSVNNTNSTQEDVTSVTEPNTVRHLQSSKVPSSRIGRLFHYGGLAAALGYGAASELIRRSTNSSNNGEQSSLIMTEANIKRLVSKLSHMRGAALKLGQFMSIQDTHMLPPEVDNIFRRVQDGAHYMPDWQMEEVLSAALGSSWADNFTSFDRIPFAAASIGQVHNAVLTASASPTGQEERVAVKIQFPNIANSIASDLGYVKMLLTAGRLLPKGLFLDRTVEVMKDELADECDYSREAESLRRYNSPEVLGQDSRFKVPWVWEGSTDRGVSVGDPSVSALPQAERNEIAARVIELCLRELFHFRLMQTDPNWTNFLWNSSTRQVSLVDFGATREYTKEFMDNWLHLLQAAASGDRAACIDWSLKLRYITGEENEIMLNAHVDSMVLLATPFRASTPQPFAFGPGSQWADIAAQIRAQIPLKLSGSFLLATRLGAVVDTKRLWDGVVNNYQFTR
ncbi:ABC1-domain-containing protein [Melanogaster broomeanus]|nr:ABC1-domain-containing protein [Melanogaster broomeanus]